MSRFNAILFTAFFCSFFGLAAHANAATLTFDDIAVNSQGWSTLSDYEGFKWTGFSVLDAEHHALTTGQAVGLVSPSNVLVGSSYKNPVSFSSSTAFTLNSGYFTNSWAATAPFVVTAFLGGEQKYTTTFTPIQTAETYLTFGWSNIDKVVIVGKGNSPIVIDNLDISAVPLPAAAPLFAAALLGLTGIRTARKRKA